MTRVKLSFPAVKPPGVFGMKQWINMWKSTVVSMVVDLRCCGPASLSKTPCCHEWHNEHLETSENVKFLFDSSE